ncbi:hypothetical protein HYH03_003913 [Edaphochlamys debaryana]|uniref:AB hydrolase-1 domain-containing protein n=1 Tax=Edaphochlamys debaryana TaxID=47281 RepID=A0A835YC79_9CHLO|nr:hypothetical protein HYH03_003913 [Edaphochlamys debaryana]|eukprot:KAG2498156.1 hypothetical protein HYH03_003913 [Edaphochlamys debaryana]
MQLQMRPLAAGHRARVASATRPQRLARNRLVVRAELEEIDPITGQPISRAALTSPVAGNKAKVGNVEWAYRLATPEPSKASADKPDVLLIHGLGSSSYSYRNTLGLLGGEGYRAFAPDWPGHGDSDKPAPSSFGYREEDYIEGLGRFVEGVGIKKPFAMVVQGYILSQYALLWAQENPGMVERLLILNTPLALNAKLRPELAAYKAALPFMRPGNKPFDFMIFNMQGSPYAMQEKDAMTYARATSDPAATTALSKTMDGVDFPKLLQKVDDGFMSWRKPSICMFGSSDPFIPIDSVFAFLDNKRTNMKALTAAAKLGHMPQEDYPEALQENMVKWLQGETDKDVQLKNLAVLKMTKKGVVQG